MTTAIRPAPATTATTRTDTDHDPRLLARLVGDAARPYIGWICIGIGAIAMLFGWLGVSREAIVAKQLPYLLSGGIGGVLIAIIGAYFLGTEELRKDGGRLERLEKQVEELHAALLARPDAPQLTDPTVTAAADDTVVVVESGQSFHRPACTLVAGKTQAELGAAVAAERGLRPCPVCEPAVAQPA